MATSARRLPLPIGRDSDRPQVLLRCAVFRVLSDREVAMLAGFALPEGYRRGAVIIRPDEESGSVFVVIEGEVRLFRRSAGGREITLRMLPAGEIFGAIFTPRTPAATAANPTVLYRLPQAQVRQALDAHRELAAVLAFFAGGQQELFDRIETVALHDVAVQLARLLVERATADPSGTVMDTHQELAAAMGVRQDHVSRIVTRFHRAGLIYSAPHRRGIGILDPERLRGYSE